MGKNFKDYFLGLDIGTNSIGWATTDIEYNLLQKNGKSLWGVREFDEAKTAVERRIYRSVSRRLDRTKQRINRLDEIFEKEIFKIDPEFTLRLDESIYYQEDKNERLNGYKYSLFADLNYTDKEYYKAYPTIYHLQNELIKNTSSHDVRLVYLALHHILKHRGHFLFGDLKANQIGDFEAMYNELNTWLYDNLEMQLECSDINRFKEILKIKGQIKEKEKQLKQIFSYNDPAEKAILGILCGASKKLEDIFGEKYIYDDTEKLDFKSKYEENESKLQSLLGDDFECIDILKKIYDWAILDEMMMDCQYLSEAKIKIYDKHKGDLRKLKALIRNHCDKKTYDTIFKSEKEKENYVAYIGLNKKSGKKVPVENSICSQEDFCKYIKKILADVSDISSDTKYILTELENSTLMPKQTSKNNSIVPYQLNLVELEKILNNAEKYLPFLSEKDKDGYVAKDKIISLMTFRVPYYIGPINDAHKDLGRCWIVKNSDKKVRPWNFEKENIVDIEESAEQFITKMTNNCTYLVGEKVIPKDSLLYSKYTVLNELNNLRIDGDKPSVKVKQAIYNDLFCEYSKVTTKKLKHYLVQNGFAKKDSEISGFDIDFKSSLKSYIDFKKIFGEIAPSNHEMIENIIKWIVLFGEDKKLLRNRIEIYKDKLSEKNKKDILNLKYSGWGRFSKKLLTEIYHIDKATGEYISIINAMWDTNNNFMELMSNRYGYLEALEDANKDNLQVIDKIDYKLVEGLYVSPSVKRSIWQTLKIIDEIVKITGQEPKKIFVEMAREDEEKPKRKYSRKQSLLDLYKSCKDAERNWKEELGKLNDSDLRNDRLYLYYTQMGRCMYTGNIIEISELYNTNIYDIDHIYPQSKIKDNSITNRVLVERKTNMEKTDKYPLNKSIQDKNIALWRRLLSMELISKEKFARLTRTEDLGEELEGFIARQLVETRQSTKAVSELLKNIFPDTEIVYSKSGNVTDFRNENRMVRDKVTGDVLIKRDELVKVRELNSLHHAKDAYLNIVIGNVYYTKFTKDPRKFFNGDYKKQYNLKRLYDFNVERNGEIAWISGENGTMETVCRTMRKNNILCTRYSAQGKGELFNATIYKKGRTDLIPVKDNKLDPRLSDVEKYGGKNSASVAYYILVDHDVKGAKARTIESVPLMFASKLENATSQEWSEFCGQYHGLKSPNVRTDIVKKIKAKSLFEVNGFKMHLLTKSGNSLVFAGANNLIVSPEDSAYMKEIFKEIGIAKKNKTLDKMAIQSISEINKEKNLYMYDLFLDKLENSIYSKRINNQVDTVKSGREKFISSTIEEQIKLLNNLSQIFGKMQTVDLSIISGASMTGKITLNHDILRLKSVKIINQSPTGFFVNEIDLLKE